MKRFLLYIPLFLFASIGIGQDAQYTQFYASPIHLNPAFAGSSVESRLALNYRNQWTAIPHSWQNYSISYDRFFPSINSGIGVLAYRDQAGQGALSNTVVGLQYAYEVRIKRNLFFRPSFEMSYHMKSINFSNLVFTDQLIREFDPASLENNITEPVSFLDFASGVILNSKTYWIGVAVHHLGEPDESLYGQTGAILQRKYSVHGGYRIQLRNQFNKKTKNEMVLAMNYKKQGGFDQLDMGFYFELSPLVIGMWYRTLPFKSNDYGHFNHDAFAVILGYHFGKYKIGYSYDITVSQLGVGSTGGSHEMSFIYEWANKKNRKLAKRRIIPCAKF